MFHAFKQGITGIEPNFSKPDVNIHKNKINQFIQWALNLMLSKSCNALGMGDILEIYANKL